MPQTLLLADDSLTIQRVIELTFAGEDITVVAVSDGDQAIARLDTMPPDIVLADVGMPGRSGYDVAQHVKQTPTLAHIPVVLLTGAFEPVDQVKAASVGCDAVLAKPFDPQLVVGRVRELLARQSHAVAVPSAFVPGTAAEAVSTPMAAVPSPIGLQEAVATPEPSPSREARVDDYFDRLDAAFATMSNSPAPSVPATPAAETSDVDWLNLYPADDAANTAASDLPVLPQSFAIADELASEPRNSVEPLELPEPLETGEPLEPREPLEAGSVSTLPSTPRALPSIADAFAAILSAEQHSLGVRPEWPALQPIASPEPIAPPEPVITDDVIDRVARRVIEQLSDRVVRETVASIASDTAERLVREEIERIKASIR